MICRLDAAAAAATAAAHINLLWSFHLFMGLLTRLTPFGNFVFFGLLSLCSQLLLAAYRLRRWKFTFDFYSNVFFNRNSRSFVEQNALNSILKSEIQMLIEKFCIYILSAFIQFKSLNLNWIWCVPFMLNANEFTQAMRTDEQNRF